MGDFEIVISTSRGRSDWLKACIESVGRPCIVVYNDSFELGAINWVFANTKIQRFLYLQDSVQVKSEDFWELLSSTTGSVAIGDSPGPFGSYLGVYERSVLKKVGVPVPSGKTDAVYLETVWARNYELAAGTYTYLFRGFGTSESKEQYLGRQNMVSENRYLKKFKGTWDPSQLSPPLPRIPKLSERQKRKLRRIRASAAVLDANPC